MSKLQHTVLFLFVLAFIVLSYNYIDRPLALYFLNRAETYNDIGKLISKAGESQWYIAIGLFGFLFYKFKKENLLYAQRYLFLLYVNLFSGAISLLLKWFFGRARPWGIDNGGDNYGFLLFKHLDMGFFQHISYQITQLADSPGLLASFPSGHTITIVAIATYMSIFFKKYTLIWFSIALLIASSRILAGDHYLSDIVAGTYIGIFSTLFLYSKMKSRL
jgi:membrane-associated phospholipid phosphatase